METPNQYIFKLTDEKIGSGRFANIFKGRNSESGQELAIKVKKQQFDDSHHLSNEASMYKIFLGDELSKQFLPEIYFLSEDCIAMEMLGPNLEDLLTKCKGKFSLKTVLMLAEQMINILEYVHSKNVVHVDVSTNNFVLGLGKKSRNLFLIDFGMATSFVDEKGDHIPYSENHFLRGTYMFSSLYNNFGFEHGRREDMVSLGYILLYLLTGTLPWEDLINENPKYKYLRCDVATLKNQFRKNLRTYDYPQEFIIYMEYNQSLYFEEKPDYDYLRKIFKELSIKMGYEKEKDFIYDWELI